MYVNASHLGNLGIAPLAIPVASAVLKNLNVFKLFGGKLVHGLQKSEFEARHSDPHWFRALWSGGYWNESGAAEIPRGLSVQDYWVQRFKQFPWAPRASNLSRLKSRGVPLSSLRLSSVPEGLLNRRFEGKVVTLSDENVYALRTYVLPSGYTYDAASNRIIPPTVTAVTAPPGMPAVAAVMPAPPVGVSELLRSPVVLIGLGLVGFMVMKTIMRPATARRH